MARSRGNKRAALIRRMRAVPEGQVIFDALIGLGELAWQPDPHRDRTAAIMGATFLEYALKKAISHHLVPDLDDPEFNYLFAGDEAPYRELAGRIRLARALGIISKDYYYQLEAIRLIRNAFAHTMAEISFQTEEISAYCDDLNILEESQGYAILVDAFAPRYTLLGMTLSGRNNRMAFAYAIFLFYWKLITYPPKTLAELLAST
jgi:hypothetical protein